VMRRALAGQLGVAPNALRIRLHRLRAQLELCVRRCLESGGETNSSARPLQGEGQNS
jgi:hypothetical protein